MIEDECKNVYWFCIILLIFRCKKCNCFKIKDMFGNIFMSVFYFVGLVDEEFVRIEFFLDKKLYMVFVYGNGFGYKVDRENLMGVDIGKGFFVKFFLEKNFFENDLLCLYKCILVLF